MGSAKMGSIAGSRAVRNNCSSFVLVWVRCSSRVRVLLLVDKEARSVVGRPDWIQQVLPALVVVVKASQLLAKRRQATTTSRSIDLVCSLRATIVLLITKPLPSLFCENEEE